MSFLIEPLPGFAYLAANGFDAHVKTELQDDHPLDALYGDLMYKSGERHESFWSRCIMETPVTITFQSVADAATALRSIQRNWAFYGFDHFRRAELIKAKLPYVNTKEKTFPYVIPHAPMGLWTLVDANTIIASAQTSSPLPAGELHFIEDHQNPPSRAYLKLQEALTLAGYYYPEVALPSVGTRCLDAGACPGGWSWVLKNCGCTITAIDRAPLADSLMTYSGITFIKHDAFTLSPEELGKMDWVFSDVICYPQRLYDWIRRWHDSGLCRNFICTIKMQGEPEWDVIRKFRDLPNSKIVHLTANKHELTCIWCSQE